MSLFPSGWEPVSCRTGGLCPGANITGKFSTLVQARVVLRPNESDVALTSIKAWCAQTCSVENEGTEIMTADN
jgi:hypothetical protein